MSKGSASPWRTQRGVLVTKTHVLLFRSFFFPCVIYLGFARESSSWLKCHVCSSLWSLSTIIKVWRPVHVFSKCSVSRDAAWCSDILLLVLPDRSWRLQRSRAEGSPVSSVESCAPAFPCTSGGKSVAFPSRQAESGRKRKLAAKTSPQRNTGGSFHRTFSCQQVIKPTVELPEEAFHSICTLNGSSHPQSCGGKKPCCSHGCCCRELSRRRKNSGFSFLCVTVWSASKRFFLLSFSGLVGMCVMALLWLQKSAGK